MAFGTNPEQRTLAVEFYRFIDGLEDDRNAFSTALDRITDSDIAGLFFTGYVAEMRRLSDSQPPITEEQAAATAFCNIQFVASLMASPERGFNEIIEPWYEIAEAIGATATAVGAQDRDF